MQSLSLVPAEVLSCHPKAQMIWPKVSPEGTIYSFTTVTRSLLPGDHREEVPFTVILVNSDDVPDARIPALFVETNGKQPQCGMRVRLKPQKAGNHILPAFEPIE